ncbi:RNA degradosome polyphosphate kinase [Evansella sp. AB-P1]|uniref:RNA degradosome polyphosphate kinase n=1 Tax=Evansella sp. AB-P1 TaxID=3037653 RepID=UPI0024201FBE|nr:RNA degradosome polyphosphate kinase [Evansella sp. AB-P1]MDG5788775.1 RNA degradosome polyphosphate kinase [Evansella sp. AB-P1]
MTQNTEKNKDKTNLEHPSNYNNRELSWLAFNKRVLQEAIDERNPLLERLNFIAIFSSNLDEFFMVRVAGLKDQVKAGFNKPENKSALTPKQQLQKISDYNHYLVRLQDELFTESIMPRLKEEGIELLSINEITPEHFKYLSEHFDNYILPVLTPMAIDAYRPFPMLLNKSLNLAVLLKTDDKQLIGNGAKRLAIVQVPGVLERTISLPSIHPEDKCFILLEEVITHFIHRLFTGNTVLSVSPFRITRNADLTIHEEGARDLLKEIEKELKKRKWGAAVRLEMQKGRMDKDVLAFLLNILELKNDDIYEVNGLIDYTFLTAFYKQLSNDNEHLIHETVIPQPPSDLIDEDDLFEAILKKDIFLHHPYESFQPIVDLLVKSADDPNVLAIKQTLYRVSGDSPIIAALANAAEKGKQVTVLVELKARFDEENNIQWARKLEKSGVHVIYGITGLKTHSKITLIIRHYHGLIQRFVHLGTGNYNDSTAKLYTDMGILTAKPSFGVDATNFFNHLSGFTEKPDWQEISAAPLEIRHRFIQLIDEEMESAKKFGNGRIIAKMNSLSDKQIILKLYEASCVGVKIDLIVRGICCLKAGVPHVSENITVRSIVDRFLEHSRIFYFYNNGKEKIFLSSADWMTRNMERRIEILFPVHEYSIKKRIVDILTVILKDNVKARIQQQNGEYTYIDVKEGDELIQSQQVFYQKAHSFLYKNPIDD